MATTPGIYQAKVTLTGTTGLVLDNIDTADPDNKTHQEIQKIIDKDEMTEQDRQRKDGSPTMGALRGRRAPRGAALALRQEGAPLRRVRGRGSTTLSGKMDKGVEAAVTEFLVTGPGANGARQPYDARKLYDQEQYRLRNMLRKGKGMVPAVRPLLPEWVLVAEMSVFNEVISWDKFVRSVEITGQSVGIGNARKLGYGRFSAVVQRSDGLWPSSRRGRGRCG